MCLCVCERVMRAVESSFNLKQNLDCCVKAPAAPLCVCVCMCVGGVSSWSSRPPDLCSRLTTADQTKIT